jgi:hypothetical protein
MSLVCETFGLGQLFWGCETFVLKFKPFALRV